MSKIKEVVKEAVKLWRCLSCGSLYERPDGKGTTCNACLDKEVKDE